MGIAALHAELIIREHKFRPLPKIVHLLGRQTVQLSQQQALAMLARHEIHPPSIPMEIDRATSFAIASGKNFITDATFFGLLGVETVRAIDHSDFEGADIILDLNEPIDKNLAGSVEFLYGGSVLDNIFDPATYIKNIGRLLAPQGRVIDQNLGSFHLHPYILASPAWYFDYYVLNGFDDCKIYFAQAGAVTHLYGLTADVGDPWISDFGSAGIGSPFGIVVVAEKGGRSTWDQVPSQDQYRDAAEWARFRKQLEHIMESPRGYEMFSCPTPVDLARVPLRWTKSFRYLGALAGGREPRFDGTIPQPARQGIKIIEASYGMNLLGQPMLRPGIVPLCLGNVTDRLAELVNGENGIEMPIDVVQLGDPAPDLGKALEVYYIYLDDPAKTLREVHIAAEAHGQTLNIPSFR